MKLSSDAGALRQLPVRPAVLLESTVFQLVVCHVLDRRTAAKHPLKIAIVYQPFEKTAIVKTRICLSSAY
jgi:hypothetical protein